MSNETAIFAGGCFWCTEAIFQQVKGVTSVVSGYATSSKSTKPPSYEAVSSGSTDFAEAIQIEFTPSEISYQELIYIFLRTHDPTTPNQQGADVGHQYRSGIFYSSKSQKLTAEQEIKNANKEVYNDKIVTEISKLEKFYPAEEYHQNYFNENASKPYCQIVINPKLAMFKTEFGKYLKETKINNQLAVSS